MSSVRSDGVMHISISQPRDLWYIKAEMLSSKPPPGIYSSSHHCTVMTTRTLLHADPTIIAAPITGRAKQIHIITTRQSYNEGTLQKLLACVHYYGNPPCSVQRDIYEICLRYTIHTKLGPSWNYVEPYLVYGANFLVNPNIMPAVYLEVNLKGENAHLVVKPLRVHLPPLTLKELVKKRKNLSKIPGDFFYDFSMSGKSIFVLPRMTGARIESVTRKQPLSSEQSTYDYLKGFWFNKHGYILPENEEDIFYVAVRFGYGSRAKPLTYPSVCVRLSPLVVVPPFELDAVLRSFVYDLTVNLPGLCTTPVGYPVSQLNPATETVECPNWKPLKQEADNQDEKTAMKSEEVEVEYVYYDNGANPGEQPSLCNEVQTASATEERFTEKEEAAQACTPSTSIKECSATNSPVINSPSSEVKTDPSNMGTVPSTTEAGFNSLVKSEEPSQILPDLLTMSYVSNTGCNTIPTMVSNAASFLSLATTPASFAGMGNPQMYLIPSAQNQYQVPGMNCPGGYTGQMPTAEKKPRKPAVQSNLNVEELAQKGLLGQLNMPTLQHFLRKHDVIVKTKDKKPDLIAKIYLLLGKENTQRAN